MIRLTPMKIQKIYNIPAPDTVDQITDDPRIKKRLGDNTSLYTP